MEAPVNSGVDEHALTKRSSEFEIFSSGFFQEVENFSDESSEGFENFCSETPNDFENFSDAKLEAWLAMREEISYAPPRPIHNASMDAALRTVVEKFSTPPASSFALSLLDSILLHSTFRFRETGTITIAINADVLARELGISPRSLRRTLQEWEESGYIVRGRGGELDGATAIRLTSIALRDPDTYWILKTKGRNVPGFIDWLNAQQLGGTAPKSAPIRHPRPLCAETTRGHRWPRPLYIDIKTTSGEAQRARETVQPSEPPPQKASEPSRVVVFIQALLLEVGVSQIPAPELLKDFDFEASRRRIHRNDLIDYIDLKVWELVDLRKESYSANTILKILMRDLEHWKAVLTNLSSQRRAHQLALHREAELSNPSPNLETEAQDLDEPHHKPVINPAPLKPWQAQLKSQVSTKDWDGFLSLLVENEASETPELWAPDGFIGQWVADNFEGVLTTSVGPCRICWLQEGEHFDIHLKTLPEPSQDSTDVFSMEVEARLDVDETLEPWRASLRDAVPDSAWRMFLKFLEREPLAEGVRLTCDDAFVATWITEHYRDCLVAHFGPLELRNNEQVWRLN